MKKDETSGLGVVSLRTFRRGELVAIMAGERVTDIRQHTLQLDEATHLYDIYFSGYFLHSCSPNVSLNMNSLQVTAINDIHVGDYLSMDYAETEQKLFKQFPCACGSSTCRGWITGNQESHPSLAAQTVLHGPEAL